MTRHLPCLLILAACQPSATDDSSPPDGESCTVGIESTYPHDGATDAYYRGAVEFTLTEPDPTATVFADFEGAQTTRADGLTVVYTPSEPLEPQTTYQVGLDYCHGAPTIEFTTSAYGQPVEEPQALQGRTWAYDLRDARFHQADYLGDLLQTFAERVGLVSIVDMDADTVDLRLAVADDADPPGQDFCGRTVDVPGVDFASSPFLSFGPTSIEFEAYLAVIRLDEMTVEATVAPDGSALGGMAITAIIDVRSVSRAVDMEVAELCELLEVYGAPCEPCPADDEPACVATAADRFDAVEVPTRIERILEADTDPRCEDAPVEESP